MVGSATLLNVPVLQVHASCSACWDVGKLWLASQPVCAQQLVVCLHYMTHLYLAFTQHFSVAAPAHPIHHTVLALQLRQSVICSCCCWAGSFCTCSVVLAAWLPSRSPCNQLDCHTSTICLAWPKNSLQFCYHAWYPCFAATLWCDYHVHEQYCVLTQGWLARRYWCMIVKQCDVVVLQLLIDYERGFW